MSALLVTKAFWIVALNVTLGVVVLGPLLLVLAAAAREVVARLRARRNDVRWTRSPGLGRIPVLAGEQGECRKIHATGRAPGS